jgi:hypothetical protein
MQSVARLSGGGIQNEGGTIYLMNTTIASNAVVQGDSSPAPQGAKPRQYNRHVHLAQLARDFWFGIQQPFY